MNLAAIVAALLLLFTTVDSIADSGVPAAVHSVVSGGYWETEGARGGYRVVIVNGGYEHVTSRVFVEWLQEPSSANGEAVIVASVEPKLPFGDNIASLDATLKYLAVGRTQVVVSGVVSIEPSRKVSAVLIALQPGVIETTRLTRRSSGLPTAAAELQR